MIQENGQQGEAAGTVLAFLLSIEEAGVSSLLTELWGFPLYEKIQCRYCWMWRYFFGEERLWGKKCIQNPSSFLHNLLKILWCLRKRGTQNSRVFLNTDT